MAQSVNPTLSRKPGASSGQRSRSSDETSMRGTHQGQQSARTASTGRTHDCKRHLHHAQQNLLRGGGHPHMNRRQLMVLLGGGMMIASRGARAQQKPMPVIGFLGSTSRGPNEPALAAFRQGLSETGYVEGQNV